MGEDAPLWLKMLADNGDAFCQYVLGKWFAESPEFGEPCRSFVKARHWLTLAAEQGYLAAKEDLIKLRKDYSQHDSDEKEA
jgi:TPR repeat protein